MTKSYLRKIKSKFLVARSQEPALMKLSNTYQASQLRVTVTADSSGLTAILETLVSLINLIRNLVVP